MTTPVSTVRKRSILRRILMAAVLVNISCAAVAETRVDDAWVRTSVAGQQSSGAFMRITADSDSRLLSVASPVASDVQIHQMSMTGDVMHMGPVEAVQLPAGQTVSLDPDGYHVMLMGLKAQIKEGDHVPLTLTIENAKGVRETVQVNAAARSMMGSMDMGHDHGTGH